MTLSAIEQLAHELRAIAPGAIGVPQIQQASLLLLDTIGCAIAGQQDRGALAVVAAVKAWGGTPDCQLIGFAHKTTAANAILANGALCRALDLNDYVFRVEESQTRLGGHPSDNIPVALAFGDLARRPGRALLEAIVVGYEVFGRAKAFARDAGEWDGVSYSGLVAPAIAARLLNLSERQTADALSLSVARCATSAMVRTGHIGTAKSISNALVARSGAEATLLAAAGVSGPLGVIDHERGMRSLFSNAEALEALRQPFENPSYIMNARIKPHPCVGTAQCGVEAAIRLHRRLGGELADVDSILVEMGDHPTVARHLADTARANPRSREAADHSIPFLLAVALLDGELGMRQFANQRWNDPHVRALMGRIRTRTTETLRLKAPENFACRLTVVARGAEHSEEVLAPPGWSRDGIVEDGVVAKFNRVTKDLLTERSRLEVTRAALDLASAPTLDEFSAALAGAQAVDVKSS